VIKVSKKREYESRRIIRLRSEEIGILKELGMCSTDLWNKFNPIMKVLKKPKDNLIYKVFDLECAVVCNAWNHHTLEYYINCLISGE
jgi:hypothetical protein